MKQTQRLILFLGLGCAALAQTSHAQEQPEAEEGEGRVQYQLVLPDEKTPETVKPEEHNPFESEADAQDRLAPGDTEENRVRDRLLKLPVVGTKRMPDGRMRVLLGNIILETGKVVPKVLPEQLVELKVKNITTEHIELAWQEKRATGLPPKIMVIPINIAPRVRYQMLGQPGDETPAGTNATLEMPLRGLIADPVPPSNGNTAARSGLPQPEAQIPKAGIVMEETPQDQSRTSSASAQMSPLRLSTPEPLPQPALATQATPEFPEASKGEVPEEQSATVNEVPPPPSPAVESVVRMLFGNPTPAPK